MFFFDVRTQLELFEERPGLEDLALEGEDRLFGVHDYLGRRSGRGGCSRLLSRRLVVVDLEHFRQGGCSLDARGGSLNIARWNGQLTGRLY